MGRKREGRRMNERKDTVGNMDVGERDGAEGEKISINSYRTR